MTEFLKNPLIKFLLIFSISVLIWFSLYKNLYRLDWSNLEGPNSKIENVVSLHLGKLSNSFTQLFGFEPQLDTSTEYVITSIPKEDFSHGVWIGEPCNGIKLMGLFAIFIIAFPGKWKNKAWFIPVGIICIHIINAIRISILTIISAKSPETLDFNHNITFQVIIYGLIFCLWYWWVQKFSGLQIKQESKNELR